MGWNDHLNFELDDAINDLIDEDLIDPTTTAYGICKQIISQGYDSLTTTQQGVFDRHVAPVLAKRSKQLEIQRIIDSNPE